MAQVSPPLVSFSGGKLGRLMHGRVDVPSYPKACEEMENVWPLPQGPMTRRPPLEYIDAQVDATKVGWQFPFIYSTSQSYNVLATSDGFEFYDRNGKVAVPAAVTATIADGGFAIGNTELVAAATLTASTTSAGALANVQDADDTTFWQADGSTPGWIKVDFGAAKTIRTFWMTAYASDATYAPTKFTISGSATGAFAGEETLLYTQASSSAWIAGEKRKYNLTTTGAFRYYKINMTERTGALTGSYSIARLQGYDTAWVDNSTGNCSMTILSGLLFLDGNGGSRSIAEQKITINETGTAHLIKFDVVNGPVNIRIGTSSGASNVLAYQNLATGTHILECTPASSPVYLQFWHQDNAGRRVDNVSFMTGTRYLLPHGYAEADIPSIHTRQIGDVLYMTRQGYFPSRLERRGARSWSFVKLLPKDGPFGDVNTTTTTLTPSGRTGEITVTASDNLFSSTDVNTLIELTQVGQYAPLVATTDDTYSVGIKISGVSNSRIFHAQIDGTFTGTVQLQSSSGNENNYVDGTIFGHPGLMNWTSAASNDLDDKQDNQVIYYRLAVKPGAYTSGTITAFLSYGGGSQTGRARIIEYISPTQVKCEVLKPFASTTATKVWKRGSWNPTDGFPVSVTQGVGRLWLARGLKIWASKSDDYTSFDMSLTDDDYAFARTIAAPSSDAIRFLGFLDHLVVGTGVNEWVGYPNTSAKPVSPTNFEVKAKADNGSTTVMPVTGGDSVCFAHRSGKRLIMFGRDPKGLTETSYVGVDLNRLSPDLLWDGIRSIAIQQEPERRVYVVLNSGVCQVLLFRREEEVVAWSTIRTDGVIENVSVVPNTTEDRVYFLVRRTVNGATVRYIEKLGPEIVLNDEDCYHLDCALAYALSRPNAIATPSGTTGNITIATDADAFAVGDVNKRLWINGGQVTITGYTSARLVTGTVLFTLASTDQAPSGRWGLNALVSSFGGLGHLEGRTVAIYADQANQGTAMVSGGTITLPRAVSVAYVGLQRDGDWKSLKLAYGAKGGSAVTMPKAIKEIGWLVYRTGPGVQFGNGKVWRDLVVRRATGQYGSQVSLYTGEQTPEAFDAQYSPDARLHIKFTGAAPATIVGYIPKVDEHDR